MSFQFAPPLDPPNLFVDFTSAVEEERRFLCDDLYPRVQEAHPEISINSENVSSSDCEGAATAPAR